MDWFFSLHLESQPRPIFSPKKCRFSPKMQFLSCENQVRVFSPSSSGSQHRVRPRPHQRGLGPRPGGEHLEGAPGLAGPHGRPRGLRRRGRVCGGHPPQRHRARCTRGCHMTTGVHQGQIFVIASWCNFGYFFLRICCLFNIFFQFHGKSSSGIFSPRHSLH